MLRVKNNHQLCILGTCALWLAT